MLNIKEVIEGKSYACKFTVTTACDGDGNPTPNLSGNKHIHNKKYESLGIIVKRDVANSLVRLIDESSRLQFVVPFHDIWDIDEIEWVNEFA
jgi:hypothetical protein|tara:strand:+ start:13117 stop:13392 length:276 start_codon:yes stop_codon:yes gene_type:complete